MEIPFVGGSYQDFSIPFNAQRCINWYVAKGTNGSKYEKALYPTPGLTLWDEPGTGAVRGMIATSTYLYAVVGNTLFQIDSTATATNRGTLSSSTGHCWLEWNNPGSQIMIVDGSTGYIFNETTNAFAAIADPDFRGATSLAYQDGYFIVSDPNTQRFYISNNLDGTNWTATDYALKSGGNDNLVTAISDHRELWLLGEKTSEVWYFSGESFPFARKIDETLSVGCGAIASPTSINNRLFWLDDRHRVVVTDGYNPVPVSTRQIEHRIENYSSSSDAIGFTYTMFGHPFYILTFPTANATLCYDTATSEWHERNSFPPPYTSRWRANCYAKFAGKHLVGDYENGKIYEMSATVYSDIGQPVRRQRICSALHKDRKTIFFHKLEIDFEAGVGLTTGQGSDPQAILDWSDDGGRTWKNELWRPIGKKGEYNNRATWYRLGSGRNRVFRITVSDPVKAVLLGADADVTIGMH